MKVIQGGIDFSEWGFVEEVDGDVDRPDVARLVDNAIRVAVEGYKKALVKAFSEAVYEQILNEDDPLFLMVWHPDGIKMTVYTHEDPLEILVEWRDIMCFARYGEAPPAPQILRQAADRLEAGE